MKLQNLNQLKLILLLIFIINLLSCSDENPNNLINETISPNILLIIADDLGKDAINGYNEGVLKPKTPNIDNLRNNGLLFNNFYTSPICTPTRASIITGKYCFRTNMQTLSNELSENEIVLQKYINIKTNNKYSTAVIGKWHLSGNNALTNPENFGIDYYSGLIRGSVDDYYKWQLTEDAKTQLQTTYISEVFTNLSIDWVKNQTKPWFLWLAYTAPHTPFHVPPSEMHNQGNLPSYSNGVDPLPYYLAAIEAMDYQIGKLLNSLPTNVRNNTVVIFIGDNGTPNQVAQSPYNKDMVKNTLYQGGINTPLIISGKVVSRNGTDDNLVTSTDLFATISELVGINLPSYYDSQSFKSLLTTSKKIRNFAYSDFNNGKNEMWTIRDDKYKLISSENGNSEYYNMIFDPYEKNNLNNQNLSQEEVIAKSKLETELNIIRK